MGVGDGYEFEVMVESAYLWVALNEYAVLTLKPFRSSS